MNKCDHCLYFREAQKLKIPAMIIELDKDELPRRCRKCYQEERAKVTELNKLLTKIAKVLVAARDIRQGGMIFNDRYTIQSGLDKICKLINQALDFFKPSK